MPDLFALGRGKIEQDQDFMGGLGIAENHGVKFLTPMPAISGLALDALGARPHLAEHLRGFGGHQAGVGQAVMHVRVEGIGPPARRSRRKDGVRFRAGRGIARCGGSAGSGRAATGQQQTHKHCGHKKSAHDSPLCLGE